MSGQRVTYAGAAEILGCHVSNVPKLIAKGQLRSDRRHPGGSLDLHQVEQLASTRAEAARQRQLRSAQQRPRRTTPQDPRPDREHEWLSAEGAGQVLGLSARAIQIRARKGTIPHTRVRGRIWVRADHLVLVANARLAATSESIRTELPDGR